MIVREPVAVGKHLSRIELIGVYSLPVWNEVLLVEVLGAAPPDMLNAWEFHAPSWVDESGSDCGHTEFWLNREGTDLLGWSYDQPRGSGPTRLAFLLYGCAVPFTLGTPGGNIRVRKVTPAPERLLRLVWIEDLG